LFLSRKKMNPTQIEEFKAFINIIPTDCLTAMKICRTIEEFQRKHPKEYCKIMGEI